MTNATNHSTINWGISGRPARGGDDRCRQVGRSLHQTVSRVLNDIQNCGSQTRIRVQRQSNERLGLPSEQAARLLVTGTSRSSGLFSDHHAVRGRPPRSALRQKRRKARIHGQRGNVRKLDSTPTRRPRSARNLTRGSRAGRHRPGGRPRRVDDLPEDHPASDHRRRSEQADRNW